MTKEERKKDREEYIKRLIAEWKQLRLEAGKPVKEEEEYQKTTILELKTEIQELKAKNAAEFTEKELRMAAMDLVLDIILDLC